MTARAPRRRCLILLPILSVLSFPGVCGDSLKVGLARFDDVGTVPTNHLRAGTLQLSLSRLLSSSGSLEVTLLEPGKKKAHGFPDPDTMMIPPENRSGPWRKSADVPLSTDWVSLAARLGLEKVILGSYEQWGPELRLQAEGVDPLSGKKLFACQVRGVTEEKLELEDLLARQILQQLLLEKDLKTAGLPQRASEDALDSPEIRPLTAEDHYENGYSLTRRYEQTGDLKYLRGAEREYRAALALEPTHFRALNNLGGVLYRLGRYEEAVSYFQKVIEINPRYFRAMENAALAYRALGRTDRAVEMWKQALLYEDREDIRRIIRETIDEITRKSMNATNH